MAEAILAGRNGGSSVTSASATMLARAGKRSEMLRGLRTAHPAATVRC